MKNVMKNVSEEMRNNIMIGVYVVLFFCALAMCYGLFGLFAGDFSYGGRLFSIGAFSFAIIGHAFDAI